MKSLKFLSFLVVLLACAFMATAAINVVDVDVDGSDYDLGDSIQMDKGEKVSVKVTIESDDTEHEDVQVEAFIRGYDHDDTIQDISNAFTVEANRKVTKKLTLNVPYRLDRDEYTLYIKVYDRDDELASETFKLDFDEAVDKDHYLTIRDVVLNPERVIAGRALIAKVRIKNYGTENEEDVKVSVSIPELGVKDSEYIDELDSECLDSEDDEDCDDSTTSEELLLRIPACTPGGEYTLEAMIEYDDGDEEDTYETSVIVLEDDTCDVPITGGSDSTQKTIITVPETAMDITVGAAGAVYPITLSNAGTESRTYVISVDGADWADFKISPSNVVVLDSGESKAVFIHASAKDNAPAGENTFAVTISSGDKILKQVAMKANVVSAADDSASQLSLRRALEIGLIVLVVILVILGLIIGFNKLKGDEEEEKEDQTYY